MIQSYEYQKALKIVLEYHHQIATLTSDPIITRDWLIDTLSNNIRLYNFLSKPQFANRKLSSINPDLELITLRGFGVRSYNEFRDIRGY